MLSDQTGGVPGLSAGPVEDRDGPLVLEGYGFGWFLGTAFGRRVIFHPGDNAGFVALNVWFPDEGLTLVMLSNEEATDTLAIASEFLGSLDV